MRSPAERAREIIDAACVVTPKGAGWVVTPLHVRDLVTQAITAAEDAAWDAAVEACKFEIDVYDTGAADEDYIQLVGDSCGPGPVEVALDTLHQSLSTLKRGEKTSAPTPEGGCPTCGSPVPALAGTPGVPYSPRAGLQLGNCLDRYHTKGGDDE